ncbi:DUF2141 domain-containing protein [Spirosoma endbachense]|uniref:DUF2141 domain-containing protein n=1 Tax=Spirosoma endbachense TaxID=2666025 RepID=A0A6P1VRW8_9BACT|nr:DUF2141 domain-containing protein [Spirosoma endbachense]QHV94106.1 DUF2141 domain-containing protein [Spirosoma endbachense]
MLILLSAISLFLSGEDPVKSPKKANLKVDIQNVRTLKGAVYVALFRAGSNFPDGKPLDGKKIEATQKSVETTFSVEPGDYAVAVFHDENGNGQMDKRIFGIPKEPYGFSNNFRPTMSAPKFNDCKFSVGDAGKTISIKLN